MSIGVYLTKGVYDIFDRLEKLNIKKVNRIITDLENIMANAPNYVEKIELNADKVNVNTLKSIFDKKYSDKDLEDFVKVFRNIKVPKNEIDDMGKNKTQSQKELIPMRFTDDLLIMLDQIDDQISWTIIDLEQNPDVKNTFGISTLDMSDDDYYFDTYDNNGRKGKRKISEFIRAYTGNKFTKGEIMEFVSQCNKVKNKALINPENIIQVPDFVFNPKDVRSTFISLVTETYPHGHEEEVLKYLPELSKDKFGNYYKIIGNSDTMFTCHLDTVSRNKEPITLITKMKEDQEMILSDGSTILGADDKAGVAILLYMMAHNIPGIYYFFLGEERGLIGSGEVAGDYYSFTYLKNVKKVISFDRKNYYSVITSQYLTDCCSNEFADSLCKELNKSGLKMGLDPTGVCTDSASFMEIVPECTNISVGYFNEHTHDEVQNITFLSKLAKACVAVEWDKLIVSRKIGFDNDTMSKYSDLISDIKSVAFYNEITTKGVDGKLIIKIEFDDASLKNAYDDLASIEAVLLQHKLDPDIVFDGDIIKIKIG